MKDDTISRQAAIDVIKHNQEIYSNNFGGDAIDKYTVAIIANDIEAIINLPSAERHGRWKPFDLTWGRSVYACTSCGEAFEVPTECGKPMYEFCPYCGARMEVQE